jgi:protein TonB
MTSAFASSPPPILFGSRDLRAHARRFFERALLLSAFLHLTIVGFVRVAQERAESREDQAVAPPHWSRPTVFTPPIRVIPDIGRGAPRTPPAKGKIVPVTQTVTTEEFDPSDAIPMRPEEGPVGPAGNNQVRDEPGAPAPTDQPPAAFEHADTPPVPTDAPKPAYPEWAREAGIEGKVLLRVLVGIDGTPKRVVVVAGPKGLSEEAQKAIARWKFHPGLANHIPVEVWVEVPVVFRL